MNISDGSPDVAASATSPQRLASTRSPWRFFLYSGIGIIVFFVPVTIGDSTTILLDHFVGWTRSALGDVAAWVALAMIVGGAIRPFVTGRWRNSTSNLIFALLNVVGLIATTMLVFGFGPGFLFEPDLGPFLFNSLVIPVGLIVPIGAVFLALLIGYGLMEWVGVMVQPLMRPVFRTPGRSAVDAVASFVGSYALGLLITNRLYRTGVYTAREAAIIATGFSTVSVSFMVIVARTLDIMHLWLWYFALTFVVTYLVTALTARLPPLSRMPDTTFPGATPQPEQPVNGSRFTAAWRATGEALENAPSLGRSLVTTLREGVVMAMQILPSIMSVGLIALVLARYTPIFDWIGYIFLPLTWALQIPEPQLAAVASATGIAEMFIPATLVAGAESEVLRLVIAVVSVSGVIFFSALVPSILATDIPLKVWQLVIIWVQRVMLSLIVTAPLAHLIVWMT